MFFFFFVSPSEQEDSRTSPTQQRSPAPALDRLAPERVSKRSSLSLDLNANENGVTEPSGSESVEDGEGTEPGTWRILELMFFVFLLF